MLVLQTEAGFSAAHRLMNHQGLCRHIHGHNYRVVVQVECMDQAIDEKDGFAIDVSVLRSIVMRACERWDHTILLHHEDPLVGLLNAANTEGIADSVVVLEYYPTMELMARALAKLFFTKLGGHLMCTDFERVTVSVWESDKSCASYTFGG